VEADVNYKVAKDFTANDVKDEAMGQNILIQVSPSQPIMVKIVHDELTKLMGGKNEGITFEQQAAHRDPDCGLAGFG
jgi:signal recognition particle subunit SRP54